MPSMSVDLPARIEPQQRDRQAYRGGLSRWVQKARPRAPAAPARGRSDQGIEAVACARRSPAQAGDGQLESRRAGRSMTAPPRQGLGRQRSTNCPEPGSKPSAARCSGRSDRRAAPRSAEIDRLSMSAWSSSVQKASSGMRRHALAIAAAGQARSLRGRSATRRSDRMQPPSRRRAGRSVRSRRPAR